MVLRVCRHTLGSEHDAEDAFQATFLILARDAASIRKRDALADWLHGVAYRTAMKAKRTAARQRARDQRHGTPCCTETPAGPLWDDVRTALDEEVRRLAEPFRSAFVLCVVQGKSREEAAAELGCKEGTVYSRLNRARRVIRQRLARRGIELCALLAALAVAEESARAVVPAALAEMAIRHGLLVAAGGSVPPGLASLMEGVTGAMNLTHLKLATAALFAVCLLAATGIVTHRALNAAEEPPPVTRKSEPTAASEQAKAVDPIRSPGECGGRVLDPEGRPVEGARLLFAYASAKAIPEKVWAISAADGRFHFTVPANTLDRSWSEMPWEHSHVLAAADGYGFGAVRVGKAGGATDLTIRLVKDDVPVRGRILDLQGQPVAGATVEVANSVQESETGDLAPWLKAQRKPGEKKGRADRTNLQSYFSPAFSKLLPPVKTDTDGRFTFKGIGRERVAELKVTGPTMATTWLQVMTRASEPTHVPGNEGKQALKTFYGATFEVIVEPSRPIVGTVRDKDTHKPLAGVIVTSWRTHDSFDGGKIRVVTDQEGHFRLLGLPKGSAIEIRAEPVSPIPQAGQLPYLPAMALVGDAPGLEPVTVDFNLKRGVWVKGRVTDQATGKPVWAGVEYFCFHDNPLARTVPNSGFPLWCSTDEDGYFKTVALPGHGLLTARAQNTNYVLGIGADTIKGREANGLFRTAPHYALAANYHRLVEIDPRPTDESITCNLTLDPGCTLSGTVLDPDGKPLAGARVSGLKDMVYWDDQPLPGADFTLRGLGTGQARLVEFVHEGKHLAGSVIVHGGDKGPVRVQLKASGTITGRLVNLEGEPMTGVEIHSSRDSTTEQFTIGTFSRRIEPKKDGSFRIEGLCPSLKYELYVIKPPGYRLEATGKTQALTIKGGETLELGTIRVRPME